MKKIYLYLEEIPLGYLIEVEGAYSYYADRENVLLAKEKYPIQMKLYNLNDGGMKDFESIPHLFSVYLDGATREDIIKSAGIEKDDSDFTKLYKLAELDFHPINFSIKAGS